MIKPKILIFDIETSPLTAYVWGRRDVNVTLNQIKKEWSVIAWAAKWLGTSARSIMYYDQRKAKDIENDKEILSLLWILLNEADIVITQNGQSFDSRKLNARFILHGMPPPKPYKHLDTYLIAKRVADFTSNKLEYLTEKLCTKYKKLSHSKFPGMSLWTECLKGNMKAWDEMKRYNIHDVLATEELYEKLKSWTPPNMVTLAQSSENCRVCGPGTKMWHKGFEVKKTGRYYRYQCRACFAWTIGAKVKEIK